jgi:hypothetical protein
VPERNTNMKLPNYITKVVNGAKNAVSILYPEWDMDSLKLELVGKVHRMNPEIDWILFHYPGEGSVTVTVVDGGFKIRVRGHDSYVFP